MEVVYNYLQIKTKANKMTEVKVRMVKDGSFPINHKLAGLVPMATEVEQAVLMADIEKNEQRDPIILWRGQVVDGRCRQKALTTLGKHILYRELDTELTEDDVKVFVKSVNTRRNLTPTQKVMIACKESVREDEVRPIHIIAKSWGISNDILKNARFIAKERPEFVEPLFNGEAIKITDKDGLDKYTNKVTTIYAYLKKISEQVVESTEYAWKEDSYITTQAGKEWYYAQVADIEKSSDNVRIKMLIAELANYKFNDRKEEV